MSEQQNYGFGKFVPGFDFLQNLSKGAGQSQTALPNLSSWVAPTLNVEELDKRISELKAVSFWLEQNARALAATIQALELQKMTLATLKGMNFNMAEVADAFRLQTGTASAAPPPGKASKSPSAPAAPAPAAPAAESKPAGATAAGGVADPLQWWGALTQQFQAIAAEAMREAAKHPAVDAARDLAAASGAAQASVAKASATSGSGSKRSAAAKAPAKSRRPAAKKTARKSGARS